MPQAHFLEAWGDARAPDGVIRIAQPLIAPIFGGVTAGELIARFSGEIDDSSQKIVHNALRRHAPDAKTWANAVHEARIEATGYEKTTPKLKPIDALKLEASELGESGSGVELQFEFDGKGLRDVVDANAQYLDAVKEDLDAHRAADATRHQTINQRLAALEAAAASAPFPG